MMLIIDFVSADLKTAEKIAEETGHPREGSICQFRRRMPVVPRVGECVRIGPHKGAAIYQTTNVVYELGDNGLRKIRVYIQLQS